MEIPINKKNKKERYHEELEERIVSLIASLFGKQASEIVVVMWMFCTYDFFVFTFCSSKIIGYSI